MPLDDPFVAKILDIAQHTGIVDFKFRSDMIVLHGPDEIFQIGKRIGESNIVGIFNQRLFPIIFEFFYFCEDRGVGKIHRTGIAGCQFRFCLRQVLNALLLCHTDRAACSQTDQHITSFADSFHDLYHDFRITGRHTVFLSASVNMNDCRAGFCGADSLIDDLLRCDRKIF